MFSEKESLASTGLYMVDRLVQQHVVIFDHVRDYYRRATVVACNVVTMDIH
jgi:hypothetical protein